MKAKEYYEKYKDGLASEDRDTYLPAAHGLLSDLFLEAEEISRVRHVKFDRGAIPILREQNDKYKAIVRMFHKEFGYSPLKPDGFELVLEEKFPGVVKLFHSAGRNRFL